MLSSSEHTPAFRSSDPEALDRDTGVFETVLDEKYLLIRELGAGSAGSVYEAEHLVVGKRVAIKLLHKGLADDLDIRRRFVAEARAAARIAHANIVDIYDFGVSRDGTPYLVMELLDGEPLDVIVEERGAVSPAYACELMLQVLAGLGAAHAEGIVHRDLKPGNILVTHPQPHRPLVKILDFGIAQGLGDGPPSVRRDGLLLGTPIYMAPEQALGRPVDHRADLYAAAVILYELLAGEPPFDGNDLNEVLTQVVTGTRRRLSRVNPALPGHLCRAVERMLCLDPGERLGSARRFAEELTRYVSEAPSMAFPYSTGSADPLPLIVGGPDTEPDAPFTNPAVWHASDLCPASPRDFPSLGLAKVAGKPRGVVVSDSMLTSPVIPRAPMAPRITWAKSGAPSYAPDTQVSATRDIDAAIVAAERVSEGLAREAVLDSEPSDAAPSLGFDQSTGAGAAISDLSFAAPAPSQPAPEALSVRSSSRFPSAARQWLTLACAVSVGTALGAGLAWLSVAAF